MNADDRQALQTLEERLWIAEYRFDRSWMDAVLADDFFEYGRSGRIHSRAACLAVTGDRIDAVIPLPDLDVQMIGAETAQVTYISIVTYDGETQYGRRSSIWVREAGRWKIRFHQATVIDRPDRTSSA